MYAPICRDFVFVKQKSAYEMLISAWSSDVCSSDLIARRMCLDWTYSHPREVFTEMAQMMPSLKNITWDRVAAEGSVTYPCDAPDKPGNEKNGRVQCRARECQYV